MINKYKRFLMSQNQFKIIKFKLKKKYKIKKLKNKLKLKLIKIKKFLKKVAGRI